MQGGALTFSCGDCRVTVPNEGKTLDGTTVSVKGRVVFTEPSGKLPAPSFFPAPGSKEPVYVMADTPRMAPPAWGATPPPAGFQGKNSGWDLDNNAPDVYVFLNRGYEQMRRDFLHLTGPVPMPPLFAFGFIDSRYHPYTEQEALDSIDTYRHKGIPLDLFVVDTDWRVNGSHGYTPEPTYFPDMPRFLKEAHQRDVRVMFNDHPEPQREKALDPAELQYRWKGLTTLMSEGVDVWWYDRNWGVSLGSPVDSLRHEVWGQRVYHDMTQAFRPDQRPLIMTNVDGIDGGSLNYPPHPASHRFPIWWTGDTPAVWHSLQNAVSNGVNEGVIGLLPYVNDDLGGHYQTPDAELYTRYLEYGCLCPITRVHCTRDQDRHPWAFGPETEKIVTDYIKLRYRLLPTIYSAAHRAFTDGTPLLRRLDLLWPGYAEAKASDEYLLGDDLLVAPITDSIAGSDKPISPNLLHDSSGRKGLQAEYFSNQDLSGDPTVVRNDPNILFDWGDSAPLPLIPQEHFSVRWSGTIGPMPATGAYRFTSVSDDGIRVFLDDKPIIDEWHDSNSETHTGTLRLIKGSSHRFRVEFYQNLGQSRCLISMHVPSETTRTAAERTVWIPPGEWQDAWTGDRVSGPRSIKAESPLWHTPMWIRDGGVIALTPVVQHTTSAYWPELTFDAYVPDAPGQTTRELYEDDGISNGYLRGVGRRTEIRLNHRSPGVSLVVKPSSGGPTGRRKVTIRLHFGLWAAVNFPDVRAAGITHVSVRVFGENASVRLPLMGAGDPARTKEGVIIEVSGIAEPRKGMSVDFQSR